MLGGNVLVLMVVRMTTLICIALSRSCHLIVDHPRPLPAVRVLFIGGKINAKR
jgi:hypothetical protein